MERLTKVPAKISPSPILEAVIGLQFQPIPPPDAVFGLVYNQLPDQYRNVEKLPILQIPDEIRQNDPSLAFQAHYRMRHDASILQVGPRMWSFATQNYLGWTAFSTEIFSILSQLITIPLFQQVSGAATSCHESCGT